MQNGPHRPVFHEFLTRREGFEPSVRLHVRLISSQVHSTTLPPLRSAEAAIVAGNLRVSGRNADFLEIDVWRVGAGTGPVLSEWAIAGQEQ